MALLSFGGIPRSGVAGAAGRGWSKLVAFALRLNGTALPLHLDKLDRAELQRTIDG